MSKNNFTNENEFDYWDWPDYDPYKPIYLDNGYNPYKPTILDIYFNQ